MECTPTINVAWNPAAESRGIYRKLLFSRRTGLRAGGVLPGLRCEQESVSMDRAMLSSYQDLTLHNDRAVVPLLFPYALTDFDAFSKAVMPQLAVGAKRGLPVNWQIRQ